MSKRILLIGDVMLDINTFGTCTRISPEAPVPIFKMTSEKSTLGGVGNTLHNLKALNMSTSFIGVLGTDNNSAVIESMLRKITKYCKIFTEEGRIATVKNRMLASKHQLIRIDSEDIHPITQITEDRIVSYIENHVKHANKYSIAVVSDYNKGICTKSLMQRIINLAQTYDIKIVCDPKQPDITMYNGAYAITPNRSELAQIYDKPITNYDDIRSALQFLGKYVKQPMVTLSEEGIAYLDDNGNLAISHAHAQDVIDVTGAGDTVLATIAYALNQGHTFAHAIEFANKAAGIVVKKLGTSFVTESELLLDNNTDKIVNSFNTIKDKIYGRKIVFTNGCFDIIHSGHVKYLQEAKKLGDILIVGMNTDDSVKKLKGNSRPINTLDERMAILSGLASVDYIIPFAEDTPYNLIASITPDILVKGGDYDVENIVGNNIAKKTIILKFHEGKSTSIVVEKIKNAQ